MDKDRRADILRSSLTVLEATIDELTAKKVALDASDTAGRADVLEEIRAARAAHKSIAAFLETICW